jgi:hypothetical protein
MSTLTARDLQKTDPKRFQKEYLSWTDYGVDYDWWDYMQDRLKENTAIDGVRVERIEFRLSYSQGDYATFTGSIDVAMWMEANTYGGQTYAERFPALYLSARDIGDDALVTTWRESSARVNYDGNLVGNTYPSGIFSALEQDAWDELIEEQYDMAGLEQALQDYVDNISAELYTDLREEYEHLTSEESFIESCECNDITFEIEECEA